MTRGTTPDIIATLKGVDLSTVTVLYVTIRQGDLEIEKTLDDVIIDGRDIHISLSQEETLAFTAGKEAKIQVRGLTEDGCAFASNIRNTMVQPILKDGIIGDTDDELGGDFDDDSDEELDGDFDDEFDDDYGDDFDLDDDSDNADDGTEGGG